MASIACVCAADALDFACKHDGNVMEVHQTVCLVLAFVRASDACVIVDSVVDLIAFFTRLVACDNKIPQLERDCRFCQPIRTDDAEFWTISVDFTTAFLIPPEDFLARPCRAFLVAAKKFMP